MGLKINPFKIVKDVVTSPFGIGNELLKQGADALGLGVGDIPIVGDTLSGIQDIGGRVSDALDKPRKAAEAGQEQRLGTLQEYLSTATTRAENLLTSAQSAQTAIDTSALRDELLGPPAAAPGAAALNQFQNQLTGLDQSKALAESKTATTAKEAQTMGDINADTAAAQQASQKLSAVAQLREQGGMQAVKDALDAGQIDINTYEQQARQDATDYERIGRADVDEFLKASLEDLNASQQGVETIRLKQAKRSALSILGPLGLADDTNALSAVARGLGEVAASIESIYAPLRQQARAGALEAKLGLAAGKLQTTTQTSTQALLQRAGLTQLDVAAKQQIRSETNALIQRASELGIEVDLTHMRALENAASRHLQAQQLYSELGITNAGQMLAGNQIALATQVDIDKFQAAHRLDILNSIETINSRVQGNLVALASQMFGDESAIKQMIAGAATPEEQGVAAMLGMIGAVTQGVGTLTEGIGAITNNGPQIQPTGTQTPTPSAGGGGGGGDGNLGPWYVPPPRTKD